MSLNRRVGEETDTELGEILPDAAAESPFEHASQSQMRLGIATALENLPPLERRIIEMRFGLVDEGPCPIDEVARAVRLSRDRVRQIELAALRKLGSLAETRKLRDAA